MLLASIYAGPKRGLLRTVVVATAGLLSGCPQLLRDDFRITDASPGAAGMHSANNRGESDLGAGGAQATLVTSSPNEGGKDSGSLVETGGTHAQINGGETSMGGQPADDASAVKTTTAPETFATGGRTIVGTPFANGGIFGTERQPPIGGIPGIRNAGTAGRPSSIDTTGGLPAVVATSAMGGSMHMAGTTATGGRQAIAGGGFVAGWWQNRAGGPNRAGAPASTNPGTGGVPAVEISDCSNMVVLEDPVVANFDDWDGVTDPYKWRFPFDGSSPARPVTATFERYEDGSGDYTLTLVQGAMNTNYAVRAHNPSASKWGGGIKLALHCIDASSYQGLSFWIRGTTPAGTVVVTLSVEGADADYLLDMPTQWQQFRIDFAKFSSWEGARPGRGISYIVFSSQLRYLGNAPQPGTIELVVDELSFYRSPL